MRKLKKLFVDDFDSEVYAVSLVDAPAIESAYVAFQKDDKKVITLSNDEKRMVSGAVLRPGFPIYRIDEATGEEFYIEFSKKAVEKLAAKYMRNLVGNNWTIDHERLAEGLYTVESWIKIDDVNDKSIALGLDPTLEIGTWFATVKVSDDEIWEQVKNGRWTGFSIEAWIRLIEENFNKNEEVRMNSEKNFIEKLRNLFNEYFGETEKTETVEVEVEMEKVEEQPAEQVEEQPAEVELEQQEEAQVQEEAEEQAQHFEQPDENEVEDARVADLEEKVADLEAQLADVLDRLAQANLKVQQMSQEPSAKPVNVKASAEGMDVMDTIRSLREGTYFKN